MSLKAFSIPLIGLGLFGFIFVLISAIVGSPYNELNGIVYALMFIVSLLIIGLGMKFTDEK